MKYTQIVAFKAIPAFLLKKNGFYPLTREFTYILLEHMSIETITKTDIFIEEFIEKFDCRLLTLINIQYILFI